MTDFLLLDGSRLSCEEKPFATGAKGDVWRSRDRRLAVKIYKGGTIRDPAALRKSLQLIVETHNPLPSMTWSQREFWESQIAWPTAIVAKPTIGVVMPYTDLPYSLAHLLMPKWRERFLSPKAQGWWKGRLEICLSLSRAVRLCHQNGLCHSDLSDNNALVDPQSGRAVMIDVDGLAIEGRISASVVGTRGYMAPELMTGRQRPGINSDKHALAVIIYKTLLDRHPLHGVRRFPHAVDGDEEEQILYGRDPLFIEHPTDSRNRPRGRALSSRSVGPQLEFLFRRAFVEGLTRPEKRPLASEWETALSQTLDRMVPCTHTGCPAEWFVLNEALSLLCPMCQQRTTSHQNGPPFLVPYRSTPTSGAFRPEEAASAQTLIVGADQKPLFYWHLRSGSREDGLLDKKPLLTFHRQHDHWLLSNNLGHPIEWYGSEERHTVPSGQMLPLLHKAIVSIGPVPEYRLFEVRFPASGFS